MNKRKLYESIMSNVAKEVKKALDEMAVSREQLSQYDSIEIFNDTYMKVYKDGLYNLIDNDGNYLSTTWFSDIKKNNGGGVDVVVKNEKGKDTVRSYTDYHDVKKSDELMSLVKHTDFLDFIDMKDIIMVTPYILKRPGMQRGVKIIAQVKYMGDQLLLGADGKLYEMDGSLYNEIKFAISSSDIHRLKSLADKVCKHLNDEFDSESDAMEDGWTSLRKNISCFIFGFNTANKEYNTSRVENIIGDTNTKRWGGDSVKVRFFVKNITKYDQEYFANELNKLGFEYWGDNTNKPRFVEYKTYTKEYQPTELNTLFDEMNSLLTL